MWRFQCPILLLQWIVPAYNVSTEIDVSIFSITNLKLLNKLNHHWAIYKGFVYHQCWPLDLDLDPIPLDLDSIPIRHNMHYFIKCLCCICGMPIIPFQKIFEMTSYHYCCKSVSFSQELHTTSDSSAISFLPFSSDTQPCFDFILKVSKFLQVVSILVHHHMHHFIIYIQTPCWHAEFSQFELTALLFLHCFKWKYVIIAWKLFTSNLSQLVSFFNLRTYFLNNEMTNSNG